MTPVPADVTARSIRRTYLLLTLLTTLATSFIWGINTLFLLDAGLSNTEAFAANGFFALGQVVFEVPRASSRTPAAGGSRSCWAPPRSWCPHSCTC